MIARLSPPRNPDRQNLRPHGARSADQFADPGTIRETASRLLGEHLDVNRVLYAEVDGDE
jgi:hypothetical protein